MKLQEKGTFEYLKRKKNQNLLIMLICGSICRIFCRVGSF